uniref:Dynein axonemal heavy chain 14 n=1 Tax=Pipistrellus kuhlii TaxID=59472 RepID=A0A7J7TP22_PIPKU|nr:dynein axonemal heavy chain 14 [Pipistrellus kuhlii]
MASYIPTDLTTLCQHAEEQRNIKSRRFVKFEDQNYQRVTPSQNQPAQTTEDEISKYRPYTETLKPEKTEVYQDDYHPDYLPERTQQVVAPKPVPQKQKEKPTGKKVQTCTYLKAKEKRLVSYDRTEPEDDDVVRHIVRLRSKLGWPTKLPSYKLDHSDARTAVQKKRLKRTLEDDGEFVYCLARRHPHTSYNPYDLQVTKTGAVEEVELSPTMEWLLERRCFYSLQKFKVISNFRLNKAFVFWKLTVKRMKTDRSRSSLCSHLFWADELFQSYLLYVKGLCEDAFNQGYGECEDNPLGICLVKLDRSRTYSLDEFCEEQLQQASCTFQKLGAIRGKAIAEMKIMLLKVAEKEEIREYFESSFSKDARSHLKLPVYRRLLKKILRFLTLVDYIFQELVRQLMNTAVTLLLELFTSSARMPLSVEKKNEDLIR